MGVFDASEDIDWNRAQHDSKYRANNYRVFGRNQLSRSFFGGFLMSGFRSGGRRSSFHRSGRRPRFHRRSSRFFS